MDDAQDDAEALEDRLRRLAERRRVAARRQHRTSSSEGEALATPASRLPPSGALHALRDLLQERQAALQATGTLLAGAAPACGWLSTDGVATEPAGVAAAAATPSSPPGAEMPPPLTSLPPAGSSSSSSDGPPSVPATARALISLSNALDQQEAQAERQARTAEAREAEAAVREAEAQHAELEALLLRHEAAAAERQRQRLEREGQLQRVQLELAMHHMAAWRIARAWRRFLHSPGRLREVSAASAIQAAWRGCASRKRTAALLQQRREQRVLLAELQAAVVACDLTQAQSIAGCLGAQAAGATAAQLVAGLERRAAAAGAALSGAAASGTAEDYQAAAAAAAQYAHLAAAVQEAAAVFAGRVAAAEEAVAKAVEGGPIALFSEAAAAAAALGVSQAVLQQAEQQVAVRNQRAAEALQAALDAEAFDASQFGSCLQRVRQLGLHAAAARAERGLQLRRHRAAAALQLVASEGSAAEVEAMCRSAAPLGLAAEADAAAARLEQRQAAATEELRAAAHSGTLPQYQAAADKAEALRVSPAVQRICREQVRWRQQEAEQQLRQAADRGELSTVRQRCQTALALGLDAAVAEAERRVNERRMAAAEQLAAATRGACEFATAHVDASRGSDAGAKQLSGWLSDARQLASSIAERGAAAALARLPPASMGWPAELRCWLVDATRAAGLELERAVGTAAATLVTHLQASTAAAMVTPVPLQPADMPRGSSGAGSSRQQGSAGQAQHVHSSLQQWRALQQDVLPLMAALAAEEGGHPGAAAERASADEDSGSALDLSGQGLRSLELLDGGSGITALDLSGSMLSSLEPLRALHGLRALRVAGSGLSSLQGVEDLCQLTSLDASNNALERLPNLQALTALRALDISSNHLTGGALLAADLPACGVRITTLRLGSNHLTDLASWMGPLPSLLHLDVSGNEVESLEGLAAAAPLLQVLVASHNRVTTLPPSLHLPFLRELWLGGNRLSSVGAWPWLPSLQLLQLEDNQLAQLAPMQGFPSLRILDLSFNALPSLHAALSSLAPLGGPNGGLQQLRLNDNPLSAGPQQQGALRREQGGGLMPAEASVHARYRQAVLQALPQLRELDSQPITEAEQQQHMKAAAMRTAAAAGAVPRPATGAVGKEAAAERQARTVLWLLTQPGALEALEESEVQHQALAAASIFAQLARQPAAAPGAQGLAAALASLQHAAGCGPHTGEQCSRNTPAAAPRGSRGTAQPQLLLQRLQRLYLLIARDEAGAAEDLMWLNPGHYRELLGRLHSAATSIQAAWRRLCAIRLRQRVAAERRTRTEAAAASCIQAAWRGWVCRHWSHRHIQGRLLAWRQEWREAQRLVAEHQQDGAAVTIQAAWRGWRVRRLLAQARQSLRQHPPCGAQELPGAGDRQAGCELDLEFSTGSLDGLLEGGASSVLRACEAPEALLPQLAAAAELDVGHDCMPALPPWGCLGSTGGSSGGAGGSTSRCRAPAAPPDTTALQLPPLTAAEQSPAPVSGPGSDWQFDDPATAAAYAQLRQRQAAAARKRALQQQQRDPATRLHEFQMRNGTGLPGSVAGHCSPRRSSGGSSRGSGGRRGGGSGSGCGSLPALRAAGAARQVAVGVRTVRLDG